MASQYWSVAATNPGLAGRAVRGLVDGAPPPAIPGPEETVRLAGEHALHGLEQAGRLMGQAAEQAADIAGRAAAAPAGQASALGQSAFSWGGYIQAVGILFLFLALLWLAVWLVRRYGRFNFLPRPGALPRGALVMEAQMPLGPRKGLMVVRFLNRRLLLGVTDQRITLLTEEDAHHEPHDADFHEIMEAARRGGPAGGKPADPSA
ncbi:flagellar biosynthetic protein FliO [Desulfovibrio sp. SGI.169]|uniref:flagellar biosynthetic protein FliO n=1 Tax=Desulfovibrio sp. SGI.169 TaxID=3420561 RepID=UPI003D01D402